MAFVLLPDVMPMVRGSAWTPIYMVVIIAIAAVLILTVIKPMFQSAAGVAGQLAQFLVF